jgi:outer membrane receptor protein involved in Fe transport
MPKYLIQICCIFIFLFLFSYKGIAQQIVSGFVKDFNTNEPLIGATVVIKGTTENSVTDENGKFEIITNHSFPLTLLITYLGFTKQEISIKKPEKLSIKLKEEGVQLNSIEIKSNRILQKQKESPLTVEAMDMLAIKETPAANFYEGLGQLKGVDLTSASLGFKVINTRGFNSTSPVRSLQIIDGVDNQSPGLNFSLGNFLGASELDIQKVELVVGASSAYYGPNAFNGVISMTTRSPFVKPGLDVSFKAGERNLMETALRWAQVFKDKKGRERFAYKINYSGMQAYDWVADNRAATLQSKSNEKNPGGYDAVNIYGDEFITGTDYTKNAGAYPGLGVYYRKGYAETDLVDYNTHNTKLSAALHYKIKEDVEAIFANNYCTGTTVYQGDNRYCLKDVQFFQHRFEIRKPNKWFIRFYNTHEDAGKSYDAYFTALLLQKAAKPDGQWKQDYENFWNNHYNLNYFKDTTRFPGFPQPPGPGPAYVEWLNSINGFLYQNYYDSLIKYHQAAQAYANGIGQIPTYLSYFTPGSKEFDTAFNGIINRRTFGQNGSMFFDRSALYHVHGEYKFTPSFGDITVGGNIRMYKPNSEGTIFLDTNGRKITNTEFGVYAGWEKWLMNDQLKTNITARVDKNQNYPYLFSPAASLVYKMKNERYLRFSFSSAIRNPTLADQYLFYQVGRATLIGNINGMNNLVTIPSLLVAFDNNRNKDSLSYFSVSPVRPEKVNTIELGYRATLFERLFVDANAYYSWYTYFIGYKIGAIVDTTSFQSPFGLVPNIDLKNIFRVATNSNDRVTTAGITIGFNYFYDSHFSLAANYSYNHLDRHGSSDPLIPAYNTPEHKFNIGITGRDMKQFGFSVNYKWVQGFLFEGSPQFTGNINSYGLVDAQVSRAFTRMHTILKLGASNLLNNQHYEVYGGPLIGRLAYVQFLYSFQQK